MNFALWPPGNGLVSFYPWQLLTYGFLHGSLTHIAFNMFGLWMFGRDLELLWGPRRFLTYYLVCVVGAGLMQLLVAALQVVLPLVALGPGAPAARVPAERPPAADPRASGSSARILS